MHLNACPAVADPTPLYGCNTNHNHQPQFLEICVHQILHARSIYPQRTCH